MAIDLERDLRPDMVVLDLEDSVKPADKGSARKAAVDALGSPWPMPVAIRINGVGTEWHSIDLDAAAGSGADFVIVPRAVSAHLVRGVGQATGKPVQSMIETADAVLAPAHIASESAALIAGTNDLRADLRLPLDANREPISASLQLIVLAARAAGIVVFDGVFNRIDDDEGFLAEAEDGRRLGFDGKSLIHPDQIEPCNRAFSPSEEDVRRARELVDAFGGGA
jgi:citrate lyase subunit beta/citryl-CoA lyase